MKKVLFVGDQPTESNTHYAVAFVGAKCFKRLVEWIKVIEPDFYVVVNANEFRSYSIIRELYRDGFKVIALGNTASGALKAMEVEHLKMPHPSGLNRKLNCTKAVREMLALAKNYVNNIQCA